jgi:tRNA dimethylallyltransferase
MLMHNYSNESNNNKILIICGPTATGKSAFAVELAKQFDGEVISADSRQVYKGLDIGSAKIPVEEMQGVPHHLIDIADPHDYFSVSDFQKCAQEKINEIHARGKLPIICGGTGMYIDAVVYNTQFPEVPPNELLRAELMNFTTDELYEKLQNLDPDRANNIDSKNKVRLIRAIEIATALAPVPKISAVIPAPEPESSPYNYSGFGF